MYRSCWWMAALFLCTLLGKTVAIADQPQEVASETVKASSVADARARARILHEAFHGALQVMHRDFFDEDDVRVLPSGSLEDVFKEMEKSYSIEIRWLAVNAKAMNINHEPQDAFETDAVKSLSSGALEHEELKAGRYRHVGAIRLASQCLKCHLPNRTSTKDRAAALAISMPVQMPAAKESE